MNKVSTERTVHVQEELDAALAEKVWRIYIDSPSGVWLILRDNGSSSVEARGSSSVVARGAATLHAWRLKKATAGPRCAVYLHNAGLNIDGGVVIDVTKPDKTASDWCDWNGVEVIELDQQAREGFKAVMQPPAIEWLRANIDTPSLIDEAIAAVEAGR